MDRVTANAWPVPELRRSSDPAGPYVLNLIANPRLPLSPFMQNSSFPSVSTRGALLGLVAITTCTALPSVAVAQAKKPAAAATPAAAAAPAEDDSVLGKVGDIQITVGELRNVLTGMGVTSGSIANVDQNAINQMVRNMLVQRIVLQEAKDAGWDQQAAVKAQLARVQENAVIESYLQSKAAPPDTYPSEAELQAAYENNKAALLVPKSYRVAQIFIAAPKDGDKEVLSKAEATLAEVKKALAAKDADYAAIASKYSQETETAGRGGEIGWLLETQIQPGIRAELPNLAVNEISDPIKLDDGYHIVRVLEIREPFTPTLDQVKPQLRQRMRQERTKANSEAYLQQLLKENPLAINELALSQVLPKAAAEAPTEKK